MNGGSSNSAGGAGDGASKLLANLPSRGLLSAHVVSSNMGGMRVYICDHDTSPPEDQFIKTNQTNILIRSLTLKNQKSDSFKKDAKGSTSNQVSKKRASDRALESKAAGKRAMSSTRLGSNQERSQSSVPDKDLQSLTVEKLRALLKEKGLMLKGKKDDLIARLRGANG
ncbi:unnamed protein product [Fraxinus pennsylvanica]|uniref:SAP domain-containing protein n=1 Tax=Fraxinus pennsylvanica TaxID=56036 RepID=A0AAD1YU29_9LAMI|nr:unnamed protein product [Fraxinus pennsylvanica]